MDNFSDFSTETVNDIFIVTVNISRATLKEAGELNKLLSDAVDDGRNKIIIELFEVEFIDSTFLGVLVTNLKKVMAINGKLRLVGFQPSVQTIVHQISLNRTFEIFETRAEAIKNK